MLTLQITGGNLEEIRLALDAFTESLDMMPLARDVEEFIIQDNEQARRLGLDKDDRPLERLQPITIATRQGDPFEEPLVPHGALSRVITDFTTEVTDLGDEAIAITGAWPNTPFISIHKDGYTSRGGNPVPSRDIVGVRPTARMEIANMMYQWLISKGASGD